MQRIMAYTFPLLLLLSGCGGGIHRTSPYDPSTVDFEASYNPCLEDCLYPSLILGLANYHGEEDFALFDCALTAPASGSVVRIVVDSSALCDKTIFQSTMAQKGMRYHYNPRIKWNYDALYHQRQSRSLDLTFSCYIDNELLDVKNLRLSCRGANECILQYRDTNRQTVNTRWLFAAYVNEDSPFIDSILSEILRTRVVTSFAAYQRGAQHVEDQVFGIWYFTLCHGLAYSSISCTSNPSEHVFSQRIRFFNEVYASRQANCIDACVFFASIMRRMGLKPVIFIDPCHAYIGYYTDAKCRNLKLLETTITSWVNFPSLEQQLNADGSVSQKVYEEVERFLTEKEKRQYKQGKLTFNELKLAVAHSLFEKASAYNAETHKANLEKYKNPEESRYQQLEIEQLRKIVQPIN